MRLAECADRSARTYHPRSSTVSLSPPSVKTSTLAHNTLDMRLDDHRCGGFRRNRPNLSALHRLRTHCMHACCVLRTRTSLYRCRRASPSRTRSTESALRCPCALIHSVCATQVDSRTSTRIDAATVVVTSAQSRIGPEFSVRKRARVSTPHKFTRKFDQLGACDASVACNWERARCLVARATPSRCRDQQRLLQSLQAE